MADEPELGNPHIPVVPHRGGPGHRLPLQGATWRSGQGDRRHAQGARVRQRPHQGQRLRHRGDQAVHGRELRQVGLRQQGVRPAARAHIDSGFSELRGDIKKILGARRNERDPGATHTPARGLPHHAVPRHHRALDDRHRALHHRVRGEESYANGISSRRPRRCSKPTSPRRTEVLKDLPWTADLPQLKQDVITEMVYQLGIDGLFTFHNFLYSAATGDDAGAAGRCSTRCGTGPDAGCAARRWPNCG